MDIETRLRSLFDDRGLNLIAPANIDACVLLSGHAVASLWRRCLDAVSRLPVGGHVVVLISTQETGVARLLRWVVLPLQLAVVTRALKRGHGVIVGRFAVFPDISHPAIVYELCSAAALYAERLLIPRTRQRIVGMAQMMVSRWAGCDSTVGAILIVVRKR